MKHNYNPAILRTALLLIVMTFCGMANAAGDYFSITNTNTSTRQFMLAKSGTPAFTLSLEYSKDGGNTWTPWTNPSAWLNIEANTTCCFRGVNTNGFCNANGVGFYYLAAKATVAFKVSGDIMSLVCGDGDRSTIPADYCFNYFFGQDANCKAYMQNDGLKLTATTLKKGCYRGMFAGCTNAGFATAPDFTAAANVPEESMMRMFQGCTKLTTVAALSNVTTIEESGCDSMFYGCSLLPQIMDIPNLKTIGYHGCAFMYHNCAVLTNVPDIAVDDIAEYGCYRTFFTCAKLATIGNLTAKTIAENGCREMFLNSLAINSVGNLNAQTIHKYGCYRFLANNTAGSTVYFDIPSISIDQAKDSSCIEMFFAKAANYGKLNGIHSIKVGHVGKYAFYNTFEYQDRMTTVDSICLGVVEPYGCNLMFNFAGVRTVNLIESPRIKSYGCASMFANATYLTTIDSIKVPVVEDYGFYQAVYGRSKLTTLNGFEVDSIRDYGCFEMFRGCTAISAGPQQIPVRYVGPSACENMFYGAGISTGLMKAPALNPKKVCERGCYQMYCASNISQLPNLTTDDVDSWAYYRAFGLCTKLTNVGNLTFQTVARDGCREMFQGSYAITQVGDVKAHTVGENAYYRMFANWQTTNTNAVAINVKSVEATQMADSACLEMFSAKSGSYYRVGSVGTIRVPKMGKYCFYNMFLNQLRLVNVDTIDLGVIEDNACQYMFNTSTVQTIKLIRAPRIRSYGCANMFSGCTKLAVIDSIKVPIVEDHGFYQAVNGRTTLTTLNGFEVDSIYDYGCYQMFTSCSGLTTIPHNFPVRYIGANGCQQMFQSATKITTPMNMGPKYIAPYGCDQMYNTCSALTSVPKMHVDYIDRAGCRRMFYYCPKVTSIGSLTADTVYNQGCIEMFYTKAGGPVACTLDTLAANYLGDSACWYMFGGNTSYTKISSVKLLKADKVGDYACTRMFDQCAKLNTVNEIRVNEIGKNGNRCMFHTCSVLANLPDTLSAHLVKDDGCDSMFVKCLKIEKLPVMLADTILRRGCYQMYASCNNSTLTKVPDMKVTFGGDSAFFQMFSGYTYLASVDTLRADYLGTAACQQMFNGCTALTTVQKLLNNRVAERGTYRQFYGCTNLNQVYAWTVDSIGTNGCKEQFSACPNLVAVPSVFPATYIGDGGCEGMFAEDKKSLVNAPQIVATHIGERGCFQMFQNCVALVTPPLDILPDKILAQGCMRMFVGCTNLATAPVLHADSVGVSGCQEMFSGCTKLAAAPTINFNYVNDYGCYMMFNGCTALSSVPANLPAIHVGEYGYCKMFNGCSTLAQGPNIAATEVGRSGCEQMFLGCAALTQGPDNLYATKASPRCYYEMFNGLTELKNVPYIHATTIADSACYNMCQNCSTVVTTQTVLHATSIGIRGCFQMFTKCIKLNYVMQMNLTSIGSYGCYYMYRLNLAQTTVPDMHCDKIGQCGCNLMFQGCSGITSCGKLTSTSIGTQGCQEMFSGCSKLATFAGATTDKIGTKGCYQMFKACPIVVVPVLEARVIGNAGCQNMFLDCKQLTTLPAQLPATTINQYGCASMFQGCTALTHGPEIMVHTLGSYGCQSMFSGCTAMTSADQIHVDVMTPYCCASMYFGCQNLTSYADTISASVIGFHSCENMFSASGAGQSVQMKLPKAPILAAKQIGAYGCSQMFYNCRSLVPSPKMLPATSLGAYCYNNMFYRCYALTNAPELPATDLPGYCYQNMFQECLGLVGPPKMAATSMGEYSCQNMFQKCTALDSVPEMKATKLATGCYSYMFNGCTKLTKVPELPARQMEPYCYQYMFNGCTALKTTPVLNGTILADYCYYYMYSGCTGITTTQDILPAKQLANCCYYRMYSGCTNLTTAPTLPARDWVGADGVVKNNCYREMFYGCSKLNCIRVFLREWETATSSSIRQPYNWVYGVSKTGDFYRPLVLDSATFSANRIPLNATNKWNLHEITLHTFYTNGGTWDGLDTVSVQRTIPLGDMLYAVKEGCLFTGWNTMPDGSGSDLDWNNPPTGELSFYAQYTPADVALVEWDKSSFIFQTTNTEATTAEVQVQCAGAPAQPNTLSACQMGTDNPGLYSLKFDSASVHQNMGGFMTVTLASSTDTMGVFLVKIPKIICTNASTGTVQIKDSMDLWITNNSTFTVDVNTDLGAVYITAGSKLVVTTGCTLSTRKIVMRGGHIDNTGAYSFTYPQLVANGAILNQSGTIDYEYLINDKQFYNLYLPYSTNVGDITYLDGTKALFVIEQYNGEVRKVGHTGWEIAWNSKTDLPPYPTLDCYRGYTISAAPETIRMQGSTTDTQRAYSYLRFPMKVDLSAGELDSVRNMQVYGYGMTAGKLDAGIRPNDAGWNLVGDPYLANYGDVKGLTNNGIGLLVLNGDEYEWQGTLRYVVMPSNDGKTYSPELASSATLPAFKNFFVQIGSGDALNFLLVNRAQNAPARMMTMVGDRMLGVRLSGNGQKERVGLLLDEQYTEDYELNADLDKWLNKGLNMYATVGRYNLSVAAISDERAAEPIALTLTNVSAGDYSFALDEEWTKCSADQTLYLLDAQSGIYTNLMKTAYSCQLPKGKCEGRFFLSVGKRKVATDVLNPTAQSDEPMVLAGKRSLTVCNLDANASVVVYTSAGACVYNGVGTGSLRISLPIGVYTVRIEQNDTEYIRKSMVY